MNEYLCPHFGQKPFSRRSELLQFEQKRLLSGTLASAMIDFSGSVEGSSGTDTSPAPSCLRLLLEVLWLVRREPLERLVSGDEPVPVVITEPVPLVTALCFWLAS
ncbi:MAG TPA: hypothetical protein V6D26_01045 [Stenomitos sp.]